MEHVWEYPRPPAVVPCAHRVRIELGGETLVDSGRALRVLETSHPPTIYVPVSDVRSELLAPSRTTATWCEFKGSACYLDASVAGERYDAVGWIYPEPSPGYEALRDHIAFYPGRVDGAWIGGERVVAQASDFYGGWITADLVGPFKGRVRPAPKLCDSAPAVRESRAMEMPRHKFTLILDQDPEPFLDDLVAAGCGDALFRVSDEGEPFAQFYRKAPTLARALATAVREIERTELHVVRIAGVALPTR